MNPWNRPWSFVHRWGTTAWWYDLVIGPAPPPPPPPNSNLLMWPMWPRNRVLVLGGGGAAFSFISVGLYITSHWGEKRWPKRIDLGQVSRPSSKIISTNETKTHFFFPSCCCTFGPVDKPLSSSKLSSYVTGLKIKRSLCWLLCKLLSCSI